MNQKIAFLKKYSVFGLSFTLTKGAVYFVPLLLADMLISRDYGILEYALAGLGFVVNGLINLGVPNAYPYFILKREEKHVENGFKLHPLWLLFLFLLNQVAYFCFGLPISLYLAFNVSYIIANQILYSTILKSKEEPNRAIFLDSGIYLVLVVVLILTKLQVFDISMSIISTSILIYSGVYALIAVYKYVTIDKELIVTHYKKILKYSSNIMLSTFFIFMITTSGRILVEYFFGFEEVAIYGFYFRLAAIVVMIHQMINVVFFKKLYTVDPYILDKYFSLFYIIIGLISFAAFLLAPFVLSHFSSFFNTTFLVYKPVYFLLSCQMIMWIATALNSSIIDRENLAKANNFRFSILLIGALILLWFLKDKLNLPLLVFIHYTIIYLASIIQFFSLKKIEIYFKKSTIVLSCFYLITLLYYFFLI